MATNIVWDGTTTSPVGKTPFGFYDTDNEFISEAPKAAIWAAYRLGYPIMDVELLEDNFYTCYEEAINEYGAIVNNFNIRENLLNLQGSDKGNSSTNLVGKQINGSFGKMIKISNYYGALVGVGGDVDWNHDSIDIEAGKQEYDIDSVFSQDILPDSKITIKRVFHNRVPASTRSLTPLNGGYDVSGAFGFNSVAGGTSFLLRPVFEDLLRMQQLKLNDTVRRSAYSFELINNKLRIFPAPTENFKLWFDYTLDDQMDQGYDVNDTGNSITDVANVPYQLMTYSNINEVGKQWIRRFFLVLSKEMLGNIRSKYQNLPIPDGDVNLDGELLRSEAFAEKETLITELKEMLEQSSRKVLMENRKDEAQNMEEIFSHVPLGLYVG